jgi:hypothetical protein
VSELSNASERAILAIHVDTLRRALWPFVQAYRGYNPTPPEMDGVRYRGKNISFGDLRQASEAFEGTRPRPGPLSPTDMETDIDRRK